jgi:hypothetical protein
VSPIELCIAAVFGVLAVRSAIHWVRHPVETTDTADEILFALFVTGRVGTWLLGAGLFVLFGTITARGRAYTDEAGQYAWLVIVFLGLGTMQLVAAWFLGARGVRGEDPSTLEAEDEPRPPSR